MNVRMLSRYGIGQLSVHWFDMLPTSMNEIWWYWEQKIPYKILNCKIRSQNWLLTSFCLASKVIPAIAAAYLTEFEPNNISSQFRVFSRKISPQTRALITNTTWALLPPYSTISRQTLVGVLLRAGPCIHCRVVCPVNLPRAQCQARTDTDLPVPSATAGRSSRRGTTWREKAPQRWTTPS